MKKLNLPFKRFIIFGLILIVNSQLVNLFASNFNYHGLLMLVDDENRFTRVENVSVFESIWTGATNTDWNTASNWSVGSVPNVSTNVIIPSVINKPVINSLAICNNITFNSGATLTINGTDSLIVKGDWENAINTQNYIPISGNVIFNGGAQTITGTTKFTNVTIGGSGKKNVTYGNFKVTGILTIEESGTISASPTYEGNTKIIYNTAISRQTGSEWTSPFIGEIIIKNSGEIKLNGKKYLDDSNVSTSCILTVQEGSTFSIPDYFVKVRALNLICGGKINGSAIIGTGSITLVGDVSVTDAGNGTSGAVVSCPVILKNTSVVKVENDDLNENSTDDLTMNFQSHLNNNLTKTGAGTLNLGTSNTKFNNLYINEGKIIIPVEAQVELSNIAYVNVREGLNIESNETGSGSLITPGTGGTGSLKVERAMSSGAWHLVSSPVSGMSIGSFLSANNSVPSDQYGYKAMRDYNPALNQWNEFFTTTTSGNLLTGKGYCIRVRESQAHEVSFTGTLQAGEQTISGLEAGKWNCIGNPYTSAIGITLGGSSSENFLTVNALAISPNTDPAYCIYIWDGQSSQYTAVSNATPGYLVQQGQAFMVKMAAAKTSVKFTKHMQLHSPGLSLKSTGELWPTIQLIASLDNTNSSTIIAFKEGMTRGLDPSYDAGLLKAGDEMIVYTRLVEDYGIPFAIQALPANEYETTIVPVGIDCPQGGKISFSAQLISVPSNCHAILEDRQQNVFTDLSINIYSVDLPDNASVQGRFFLHTSNATTGTDQQPGIQKLSAWAIGRDQLQIQGKLRNRAIVSLYDIQGRLIFNRTMQDAISNRLRVPSLQSGIYLLRVIDQGSMYICKVKVDG